MRIPPYSVAADISSFCHFVITTEISRNLRHIFFGRPASLPLDGFQLHFVCFGPFTRQDIFTLNAAVNHDNCRGVIVQIANNDRHGGKPRKLAGVFAPVAGNKFIAAVRTGTGNKMGALDFFVNNGSISRRAPT